MSDNLSRDDFRRISTLWRICQTYDYFFVKTVVREYTDDSPEFWDNFVKLVYERGILCEILGNELKTEVEYTLSETQLFRSNKGVTYVTAAMCRRLTEDLLVEYINPLLEEINSYTEPLEIDNSKVGDEKAKKNIEIVVNYVNKLFDTVTILSKKFCPELTYIFTKVRLAVKERYGDEEALKIVGAFVFLRLINPVLLTPLKFSSKLTKPSPSSLRSLIIVTKITQSCVNQSSTPFQEKYMLPITDYALGKYSFVTNLLDSVSKNEVNPQHPLTTLIKPSLLKETGMVIIQNFNKFASSNLEKFKSFCDFFKRRGHTQLIEEFSYLIDPTGKIGQSLGIQENKVFGVVLDQSDDKCIRNLIQSFDQIIEGYQQRILKSREEIIELQTDVRKRKDAISSRASQIDTINKEPNGDDKLSVPPQMERKRTIFKRGNSLNRGQN
ncbi:hypothetical protein ENUP19_0304G0047 [Entamoeba nuttalli]|uniref:Ras GTPase-activating protein, putative n=2 Tax=Entamoeba nuttalli TaxID=412467 RepID=K2HBY8_ENTNP|nr:Ras GTPase-activating protein, putative [Entamoeba nuttalli P19]EKE40149.1 Ras GTPase-activating protein, putative [Entamoeba nuttalli P19]|eukprot:XP_008857517.1 Ras GTPase-activating protein, putative [Entamoeba nuttalli P19]